MQNKFSTYHIATAIAVLFHAIGLVGLLCFDRAFFIASTPVNLLLMLVLLVVTTKERSVGFFLFFAACFVTGIAVELLGVHTGLLFGNYRYGTVLGPGIKEVPWMIGVNWFIVIYCSGASVTRLLNKLGAEKLPVNGQRAKKLKLLSVIIDGATLAVFFDWLMEPVAVKLGYWKWLGNGSIPFYNYACWFVVSILLLTVFRFSKFNKENKFALNLLLIQLMFFLILRTFML